MPATTASPVLPPSWQPVLETIEEALAQRLRHSAEPTPADAAPTGRDAAWQEALARLDDRLAALDACAGRAARSATKADTILAEASADLDRWLGTLQAARRKLAEAAGGAVS